MRKIDKEISDDSMERIFTNRKDAEKYVELFREIFDSRNHIVWSIENYENYELKYRIAKKYNL